MWGIAGQYRAALRHELSVGYCARCAGQTVNVVQSYEVFSDIAKFVVLYLHVVYEYTEIYIFFERNFT